MAQKAYSLSHTKWMCKYHIVFTPKYWGNTEKTLLIQGYRNHRRSPHARPCAYAGGDSS